MGWISSRLRIGEKLGLSFGFVGLLFLGVIWQYHATLTRSLGEYQRLQDVFEANKSLARGIESSMLTARIAEKDFLLQRRERFVTDVARRVAGAKEQAQELDKVDPAAAATVREIIARIDTYHSRFQATAEAWRKKGLDESSGLQGAFREVVHRLQKMAAELDVGELYLQLLQVRRGEKDLGLRREAQYRDKVLGLLRSMRERAEIRDLDPELRARLLEELDTYLAAFEDYAVQVLAQQEIHGGKGPFRQAAHRIEALLNSHFVYGLEVRMLQLRRREKDYLLRGDKKYVAMVEQELQQIVQRVTDSAIPESDKAEFKRLLSDYERDFLALVAQNDHIERLSTDMHTAVTQIASLVHRNVESSHWRMAEKAAVIETSSRENARLMLWIALGATLLGLFFVVVITRRITRPLVRMAGMLDRMAYEEPVERMPTVAGGRDEVNAMAESVNAMADHKARFIAWWKASMAEANAGLEPGAGSDVTSAELDAAREQKRQLARGLYRDIRTQAERSLKLTRRILEEKPAADIRECTEEIDQAGKLTLVALDVLMEGAEQSSKN